MRKWLMVLFMTAITGINGQNPLVFPDTLSGNDFILTIHTDSVQFLPGQKTLTNAFNDYSYLGPTLILYKGAEITMHVQNMLSDTSTVHWHGLHVPSSADGGPHTIILPGTTWEPSFVVRNHAAMYWYHPHTHMKTGMQTMRGAAGLIIVRDSAEDELSLPRRYGVDDFVLVVQSQELGPDHQILWRGMHDSILLVNGVTDPNTQLPAQIVRIRLLNGSQERNFNFGFTGNLSFRIIGNDGGLLPRPVNVSRIRLSPGERAELLLDLTGKEGQMLYLMSYASELPVGVQGGLPMMGDTAMYSPLNGVDFNILQIRVGAPTSDPVMSVPSQLVTVTPWNPSEADTTRVVNITAEDPMSMDGPFFLNNKLFDMDRIDYRIPLNNIEIWSFANQTMVAHPVHFHDVQFFVLDRDGITVQDEEKGFKDVVMVGPQETVRFITKFEDYADTVVPYMFHCHVLMHEDDGMMLQFLVMPGSLGTTDIPDDPSGYLYPNPVTGDHAFLSLKEYQGKDVSVSIHNLTGAVVLKEQFKAFISPARLTTNHLASGIYVLRIYSEGRVMALRFSRR